MKKAMFIVLSLVTVRVMSQKDDEQAEDAVLKGIILQEVYDTHMPPLDEVEATGWRPATVKDFASHLPTERVAKLLEELVQDRLSALEKAEAEGGKDQHAYNDVHILFQEFKDFHGTNTLAFIRECVLSHGDCMLSYVYGFDSALESYIHILGDEGDSTSFLEEANAKRFVVTEANNQSVLMDEKNQIFEQEITTVPIQDKQNDEEGNSAPWQLPLLIGIAAVGGVVMAWRHLKRKKR